jgi:hypothetical protein
MSKNLLDNGTVIAIGIVGAVAAVGAATKRVRGSRSTAFRAGNRGSSKLDAVVKTPHDAMNAIKGMPKSDFYVIVRDDDGHVMGIEPYNGKVRELMRLVLSMGEATTAENLSPQRAASFIVMYRSNMNLFFFNDDSSNPYRNVDTYRPSLLLKSLKMADYIVYDDTRWKSFALQGYLSREWK